MTSQGSGQAPPGISPLPALCNMEDDAARPPLPSQKLLQQLQHTQALRQERFAATVGGKLRGLLASSDLHAQHAVKSDEALCARPDASVHALLSDVQPVQVRAACGSNSYDGDEMQAHSGDGAAVPVQLPLPHLPTRMVLAPPRATTKCTHASSAPP